MTDGPTTHLTHLYTDVDTGALKERQYRLVIVAGPDKGIDCALDGTTMLGTHENNDIVLTDDTVSRYHLELQVRRDGLRIKDLETTNGTHHGGARVESITVREATRIRLGKNSTIEIIPTETDVRLGTYTETKLGSVIGSSQPMRALFALLNRVATTDVTILLEGETGSGKEIIAEAIHEASNRSSKELAVVDCAALPKNLIGSELFGHVRGAFTGADSDKKGLIEVADGGTLFLDEIGELDIDLQPQLLRVLEKREVRRVGETKSRPVNIRIIAATHRNLKQMVKDRTFREDLYYRLAVVRAVVPPLRERREDIPLLAHHFADILGAGFELSPTLVSELSAHNWPGNVRELRNVVERALSLGRAGRTPSADDLVTPAQPVASLPRATTATPVHGENVLELPFKEAKGQLIEAFERDYLSQLLERHKGNISRAANAAGIDRNYIHRLVKKYGIKVDRG